MHELGRWNARMRTATTCACTYVRYGTRQGRVQDTDDNLRPEHYDHRTGCSEVCPIVFAFSIQQCSCAQLVVATRARVCGTAACRHHRLRMRGGDLRMRGARSPPLFIILTVYMPPAACPQCTYNSPSTLASIMLYALQALAANGGPAAHSGT